MALPQVVEKPKDFPTAREMARWAYDFLAARQHGEIASYAELSTVLTIDATSRRGRAAVLRAGRHLLRDHSKLLINIRGVGYQIAQPNDHAGQSQRYRRLARSRLRRALDAEVHVALQALSPRELAELMAEQVRAGLTLAFERRLSRRKALPPKDQLAMPSGQRLVQLLTKSGPRAEP
jgi:hypothetical protein